MSEEDEKLQKHLIDEMMKVSKTNPDVMIYMSILMKNYEKLEQKIERLKEELKYTVPVVEYNKTITKHIKEKEQLHSNIKEVREYIEKNLENTSQTLRFDKNKSYNTALIELKKILDKADINV